ncbi:hypothetical protein D3C87_1154200 [compost metagenome]
MVALRAECLDCDCFAGLGRRDDDRLGCEVKGNAEYVGVLHVEEALLVQLIGLAAQGSANHLFAQQLGAERTHTKDVGHGIGIPAFGEHGHRHDATDLLTQAALLANGVHHLTQQFAIAQVFSLSAVAGTLDDLALEAFDFVSSHTPEIVVQRLAGFELLAVDQQGVRARQRLAMLVEVAEQLQPPRYARDGAIFVGPLEPGDVIEHQFGSGGVVAHHDETRWHVDTGLLPGIKGFEVMPVQGFQRGLQFHRDGQRIELGVLAAPFLRHFLADVLPELAVDGHFRAGDVVGHRHAWQFDDAAFDGIHQRKIAHRPGKQCAFHVAGAGQEEWRG